MKAHEEFEAVEIEEEGKKSKKSGDKKKQKHEFIVEYQEKRFQEQEILDLFFEEWKKSRKKNEIKDLKIYLKVEESVAYCVVNESEMIEIRL
ncbi:MAG: hypothetical protein K0M69_10760 [Youngiibacter sp.]|jgi:hypothetical protein|nr:hypothetical protein [Youngiibacter sp.]